VIGNSNAIIVRFQLAPSEVYAWWSGAAFRFHVFAADGVFRADGAFVSLPAIPEALLERGFRRAVLRFLVRQGAVSEQLRDRMLGWRYSSLRRPSAPRP
jgi:hypothetical protein